VPLIHAPCCLQTAVDPAGGQRSAGGVFRRSQALWGTPRLSSTSSSAALGKLARPTVQLAEAAASEQKPPRRGVQHASGWVHRAFAAAEWATGFTRNQLSLGLQVGQLEISAPRCSCPCVQACA
jgi:hypothetical protein